MLIWLLSNAELPIVVTLDGIVKLLIWLYSKALFPIDVTFSPSVKFAIFVVESLAEANAESPISPLSTVKSLICVPNEL